MKGRMPRMPIRTIRPFRFTRTKGPTEPMSKDKEPHDKAARRKLRRARKVSQRGPARQKDWDRRLTPETAEDLATPPERMISRRDRRHREVNLARDLLHEQQAQQAGEVPPGAARGVVTEIIPGGCLVDSAGTRVRCVLRGLLKSLETRERNVVAVGDEILYSPLDTQAGVIERVLPRRSVLSRKYAEREHVVAANIDQLVVVVSVSAPPIRTGLIDRYLVAAENGGLRAVILVNKIDLAPGEAGSPYREVMRTYVDLGYGVAFCSAVTGEGLDSVRDVLRGKSSIFAGQSGTGKSSILNALQPGLRLRVGEISESTRKGIHTTTNITLLPLEFGGYVVDTPGIREFALWGLAKEDLPHFFPEFEHYLGRCRLRGCTHTHEPGCEVKAAVEEGRIHPERYDSYCRLYESLE